MASTATSLASPSAPKLWVLITGSSGFIASVLIQKLLALGALDMEGASQVPIHRMVLLDFVQVVGAGQESPEGSGTDDPRIVRVRGDIRTEGICASTMDSLGCKDSDFLSVFHLGGIMSGDGETPEGADLAFHSNFRSTRDVLEFLRRRSKTSGTMNNSKMIFTSTNAVFAPTDVITDSSAVMPRTSYGTAKAMCDLTMNDYFRRGYVDSRIVRLPAVVPRTRKNASAAGAFSLLISQPLWGRSFESPIPLESTLPCTSIFSVTDNLLTLHNTDSDKLGDDRIVVHPAICYSLHDALQAVKVASAESGLALPDPIYTLNVEPAVAAIVATWPQGHNAKRWETLGFRKDENIERVACEFAAKRDSLPHPDGMPLPETDSRILDVDQLAPVTA